MYTKGGSEPLTSSPRSEFTTPSLISSNEVCGEHEIAPGLIQDLLEIFSSRCWPRSPREIVFSGILKSLKKLFYQIGSIGDRLGKVWLVSSGTSNFWPSIVTGLRLPCPLPGIHKILQNITFVIFLEGRRRGCGGKEMLFQDVLVPGSGKVLRNTRQSTYVLHPRPPRIALGPFKKKHVSHNHTKTRKPRTIDEKNS